MSGPLLDIVVPAHRARFLGQALESLACQEDRAFRVLVGDDASPEDLEAVCTLFRDRMDIVYHRFEENLGGRDLVAQWTRCVALGDSPWVWLFSDDDVASPGCVGALRRCLGAGAVLARLDLEVVGSSLEVLDRPASPPASESREEFLWQRFKRRRESFAVEYAFPRARLASAGGFVEFPAAWCSDDATWWRLAGADGIRHAAGGTVSWRWSGSNITSSHARDAEKGEACVRFLEFIGAEGLSSMEGALGLVAGAGSRAAMEWLVFHLDGLAVPVDRERALRIESRVATVVGSEATGLARRLSRRNWRLLFDRIRRAVS